MKWRMMTNLIIATIGNLIDMFATLYLYGLGYTEANPIMALLLPHPWLFATVKIIAMTTVVIWLWRNRDSRNAKITARICAFVYGAIAL